MIVAADNSRLVLPGGAQIMKMRTGRVIVARPRRLGLGQTQQQIVSGAASGASSLVSGLVAASVVAGPVGAAIGAGISLVATIINTFFSPNVQKIQASNDANQIEAILQSNLANWLNLAPSQKFESVQTAALAVFDQGWAQYCNLVQPDLAKAPDSISDRQEGSCAYHTAQCAGWSNGVYTPNGPNQSTGCCWNWFVGYRDPIANDPNVIADPATGDSSAAASALNDVVSGNVTVGSTSVSTGTLLLLALAGLVAWAVLS